MEDHAIVVTPLGLCHSLKGGGGEEPSLRFREEEELEKWSRYEFSEVFAALWGIVPVQLTLEHSLMSFKRRKVRAAMEGGGKKKKKEGRKRTAQLWSGRRLRDET